MSNSTKEQMTFTFAPSKDNRATFKNLLSRIKHLAFLNYSFTVQITLAKK